MYTEKDFENASKQARWRLIALILMAILLLFAAVMVNRQRLEYPAMAMAALGFMITYFVACFKVVPWIRYNRFMREMKNGQRRKAECIFKYFDTERRMHDGVEVYDMIVTVGTEEEDERLYYWDIDKKQPELREGDRICVESYGNFVVSVTLAG